MTDEVKKAIESLQITTIVWEPSPVKTFRFTCKWLEGLLPKTEEVKRDNDASTQEG